MINTPEESYKVALPVFEGPLDLLLHLIEREELDITQVSLAQVTNQYLEHLAEISERDPDKLADFLVVAAKLLLIKSRVLLPKPPSAALSEDEQDAGEDLIRQLIEYKKFKEVAGWLQERDEQGLYSFIRIAAPPPLERSVDLGDITLDELLAAVREALAVEPPAPSVDKAVPPRIITIADQIGRIERATSGGRSVSFQRLLVESNGRLEIIVTFLALLEMVKQLRVAMRQERPFGDIMISATPPEQSTGNVTPG
jgi:segregation and condensation protein A